MSRSYKKTPYCGDEGTKSNKKVANKKVRRLLKDEEVNLSGTSYKKAYESWDIVDYSSIMTFEQYWEFMRRHYLISREEAKQRWEKYYKRK